MPVAVALAVALPPARRRHSARPTVSERPFTNVGPVGD